MSRFKCIKLLSTGGKTHLAVYCDNILAGILLLSDAASVEFTGRFEDQKRYTYSCDECGTIFSVDHRQGFDEGCPECGGYHWTEDDEL